MKKSKYTNLIIWIVLGCISIGCIITTTVVLINTSIHKKTNISQFINEKNLGTIPSNDPYDIDGALCWHNIDANKLILNKDIAIYDNDATKANIKGIGDYKGSIWVNYTIATPVPDDVFCLTVPQPPYILEIGVSLVLPAFAWNENGELIDNPSGTYIWQVLVPAKDEAFILFNSTKTEDKISFSNVCPEGLDHPSFEIYLRCYFTSDISGTIFASNQVHSTISNIIYNP